MMLQPPGPKGIPFIGNLEDYELDRLGFITDCAKKYGDVVKFSDQVYIVNSPNLIGRVLTKTNQEFTIPTNLLKQNVDELATSKWMQKRRIASQCLSRDYIDRYSSSIFSLTLDWIHNLQIGKPIVFSSEIEKLTSSIMSDFCFSNDANEVQS